MPQYTPQQLKDQRKHYVEAFNDTMINIWAEKIQKFDIIDTGTLLRSLSGLHTVILKSDYSSFEISEEFVEYGLYQDRGTGKETWKGNPGDISRKFDAAGNKLRVDKIREKRPWFSKKYFASVMNLKDFMADNLGKSFGAIISNELGRKII